MTRTPRGKAPAFLALVALWALPLVAVAAEEGEVTSTTAEIEISATSITAPTNDSSATGAGSASPDGTLPFTGTSSQGLAWVAASALAAGSALILLTRGARTENAAERVRQTD